MSSYYKAENQEIVVDHVDREVTVFVMSNYNGRVYLILSFDQIKNIDVLIKNGGKP